MTVLVVPYHLDERLDPFDAGIPVDVEVNVEVTAALGDGSVWERLAVLYDQVADAVARQLVPPLVVSGDCTTSLGVLAGLQRAGRDVGVVWYDAHADFHTEDSTTSGYLGGMPLALAAGVGTLTLPGLLGLRPVPEERVVLVDARDTDPAEHRLLEASRVRRRSVEALASDDVPAGDLYLHLDLDVCDPDEVPDLLYPAPGGPSAQTVLDSLGSVVLTGRVAAVGVAATWRHGGPGAAVHRALMRRLLDALQPHTDATPSSCSSGA